MTGDSKAAGGRFFEDFSLGEHIRHATPRTVTAGDVALYTALYGSRFVLNSSSEFAEGIGLPAAPVDDWLAFHLVFGKTVPDISLNAVANLGYADGRFYSRLYPGDTVTTTSEVIGLKENSSGKTGVVYVRSVGENQDGAAVVDYVRWVMVNKRDPDSSAPEAVVPELPERVAPEQLVVPGDLNFSGYNPELAGSPDLWDDYAEGERIDHMDGTTVAEAEHALATRLYQNTARVHFNQQLAEQGKFKRRLVYGGHVISMARSLTFNGLANACLIAGLNGGRHVAPVFAGDTIYAWSEVLEKAPLPLRHDIGALRLRTVATRDQPCAEFPDRDGDGNYLDSIVLDLDYWVLMPRR